VCLPLFIFPCTIKSRSSLLAPAHLAGSGKRAVKRLWYIQLERTICDEDDGIESTVDDKRKKLLNRGEPKVGTKRFISAKLPCIVV